MVLPLLGMSVVSALMTGAITWGVARRYGRRQALLIPVLALAAVMVLMWRATGSDNVNALGLSAFGAVLAGPAVAGALLALLLSRPRGR